METNDLARRIIAVINLAGFSKAFQSIPDTTMLAFVETYYSSCEKVISEKGGTVIKFMGDGCLAVFPLDGAKETVEAVLALQSEITRLADRSKVSVALGANLHLAPIIDTEIGSGSSRRRDIIGRGVNQTFLLGRGAGIRISEPLYRALPSAARSPWTKHKPPAVYHLDLADGIYEGMGQSPAINTLRW